MRILICGGRNYDDEEQMSKVLDKLLPKELEEKSSVCIITGGASGADSLAYEMTKIWGYTQEVYPAEWDKYGRSAGPRRNKQMLDTGIDLVIAFPGGRGTAHMVKIARQRGVDVYEVDDE